MNTETESKIKGTEIILQKAELLVIKNTDDYCFASEELKNIKKSAKQLDEQRKSLTKPLDESKKKIMAMFKAPTEYLEKAEAIIKKTMVTYQQEEERLRREEEEMLKNEAEAKAEAERQRLLKKADDNFEDEDKVKEIIKDIDEVKVERVRVDTTFDKDMKKLTGSTMIDKWCFKIINEKEVPREYLMVDEKKIGAVARATKGTVTIPGVEIFNDPQIKQKI